LPARVIFGAAGGALVAFLAMSACRDRGSVYSCPDCNVVLISVDTLRADHVGAYGYPRPTTPNIDALAARSVVFENAISQSSWTRPAHLSMLTGLHPNEHGVLALKDRAPLADDIPTLASVLFTHGYRTAGFTGGVNVSATFGFDRGFETYRSNGKYFRDNLEETKYWLDRHAGEKFFLFWHGYDPHTPYLSDAIDRAAMATPARPEIGLRRACRAKRFHDVVVRYVDEYDAAVRRADRYVGKLLAELDARSLLERTVVIVTSDHGEEFREHGRCFHLSTLYREVLHVPLLVSGPGLAPRRIPRSVPASVSIAPTILHILGATNSPLPGPSLASALAGGDVAGAEIVSETSRDPSVGGEGHLRALTTEDGKLVHSITRNEYAAFDRRNDPEERDAIATGALVDALRSRLDAWLLDHPSCSSAAARREAADEDLDAQLRALGYRE
jgi:arylsulfatase A-like enzyme